MLVVTVLITIVFGTMTYMQLAPQFGASTAEIAEMDRVAASPQRKNGRFVNRGNVHMTMNLSKGMQALREMITSSDTRPSHPLPTAFDTTPDPRPLAEDEYAVTWYGHSSVLLELDGRRLLIDPVLSDAASPLPVFGRRFPLDRPLEIAHIPDPDAVLITHDHYDHLDYETIRAIAARTPRFIVPLGVSAHLRLWGVPSDRITELDWWEETTVEGIRITATPAQHFSGRGLRDRNATLWMSYVIAGRTSRIYFSGDSGYGSHFREIGERFGPFDFTMLECGQYNEKWRAIHSMPEESVQAHRDLRGGVMMPIHWGAFTLAPHRWTEPVERAQRAAGEAGIPLAVPRIGERFIPARGIPREAWWMLPTKKD